MKSVLLLVACCAAAHGQCLIGGTVRDAESARPLARTRVFAKPPDPRPDDPAGSARPAILRITDAAGAFCFEALDPGVYQLIAQQAGYLTAIYGAKPGQNAGTPFPIDGRTAQPPVVIRLVAGASIGGTLVDDRGQPVENAMINLMRKKWDWVWEPAHVTISRTESDGSFQMPPVPAGTYYLSASRDQPATGLRIYDDLGIPDPGPLMDEKGRPLDQFSGAATFYNGSYSFAHATPIEVRPGQEVSNLVLALRPPVWRKISGRISGNFDPRALASAEVDVTTSIEMPPPASGIHAEGIQPDGTFTVAGLGPLEYDVKVAGLPGSIATQVDLANGDAEGLVLEPARSFDFAVTAHIEGQDAAPVQPMAICDLEHGCQQRNPPDDQGVYHFTAVRQGIYRFHSRGPGVYVKSLLVDGRPVADGQLDLRRSASNSIAVVLGSRLGALEGQLEKTSAPAAGVSVMLVAEIRYSPAVSNNFVAADAAGRFHFDGVAPGRYRVLAIEGFDDGPWGSPELFAALAAKSVAVEVGEGETRSVMLPVVSSADWEAALRKVGM